MAELSDKSFLKLLKFGEAGLSNGQELGKAEHPNLRQIHTRGPVWQPLLVPPKRLSNLPKITKLGSGRAEI